MRWRALLAMAIYAAFWLAILFGYLRVDDSGTGYELLRAAAVFVPAFALGLIANRWWAVLAGLVFLLAVAMPERETISGSGVDVTLTGTYDVSLQDALELLLLTTPWVLLGVIVRRWAAARRQPTAPRMKSTIS